MGYILKWIDVLIMLKSSGYFQWDLCVSLSCYFLTIIKGFLHPRVLSREALPHLHKYTHTLKHTNKQGMLSVSGPCRRDFLHACKVCLSLILTSTVLCVTLTQGACGLTRRQTHNTLAESVIICKWLTRGARRWEDLLTTHFGNEPAKRVREEEGELSENEREREKEGESRRGGWGRYKRGVWSLLYCMSCHPGSKWSFVTCYSLQPDACLSLSLSVTHTHTLQTSDLRDLHNQHLHGREWQKRSDLKRE